MEKSYQQTETKNLRHILGPIAIDTFPARVLQGIAVNSGTTVGTVNDLPDTFPLARFITSSNTSANAVIFGGQECRDGLNATIPGVYNGGWISKSSDYFIPYIYNFPRAIAAYSHNASQRPYVVELYS